MEMLLPGEMSCWYWARARAVTALSVARVVHRYGPRIIEELDKGTTIVLQYFTDIHRISCSGIRYCEFFHKTLFMR